MTVRIVISKRAQSNINAIADWWRENRGTMLFIDELDRAWELLATLPAVGPPYRRSPRPDVRRLLLSKTQYYVYYEYVAGSDELTVITLWSTRRGIGPDLSLLP